MCFKEIASRIRNVTDGFNQIEMLLDKHYKMSFHMEVMLDKLAKKVDRIYEIVDSEDAYFINNKQYDIQNNLLLLKLLFPSPTYRVLVLHYLLLERVLQKKYMNLW